MLKGVIFDMDGTITLTEQLHYKSFNEVIKEHGVNDYTFEEQITKYAGSGSAKTFEAVFAARGLKISPEEIEKCVAKKKGLYTKIVQESEITVVDGVKEFVKKIHGAGLKKIIATGNSNLDIVRDILKKVGLLEYFPEIISINEVARGKPFPDVFLEASKRINCEPTECVVLEDSANGIEAAHAAGIRSIALETTLKADALTAAGATYTVKNYNYITDEILYGNK